MTPILKNKRRKVSKIQWDHYQPLKILLEPKELGSNLDECGLKKDGEWPMKMNRLQANYEDVRVLIGDILVILVG